mmetsp:Transcript_26607/g.57031  ORF Transcript_26607/g.57031 Transcript_26607/m.57031 type:complete len:86 (-) Transcript_26607:161-418(-)
MRTVVTRDVFAVDVIVSLGWFASIQMTGANHDESNSVYNPSKRCTLVVFLNDGGNIVHVGSPTKKNQVCLFSNLTLEASSFFGLD